MPFAARPRARIRVVLGAVLLAAAVGSVSPPVALAVPGSAAPGSAVGAPMRIRMFGDSVMLGAHDDLLAAFPGTDTNVDAIESRSLLGTTPVLAAHPDLLGDVVVLDLGYNDMPDGAVFRERVDAMMQALANVPRVVWFTQSVFQPTRAAMNDELRAAADRYSNLDVVDWDAQVAAHPEYVYADGLHLTSPGRAAFAVAALRSVDTYRESLTHPRAAVTTVPVSTPAAIAGASTAAAPTTGPAGPAGPAGRGFAAAAIGDVTLVVLAGMALLRRERTAAPATSGAAIAGGSGRSRRRGRTRARRRQHAAGIGAPGRRRSA